MAGYGRVSRLATRAPPQRGACLAEAAHPQPLPKPRAGTGAQASQRGTAAIVSLQAEC